MPTRLLHVGSESDGLQLCERETIPTGVKYTALSHCWGSCLRDRKILTQHNISAWKRAIQDSDLMQTFKDAVKVTRELGIQYLWIDSLCIIQDSEADWLHESSLMSNVYKYAHCTIAAAAADNDEGGCFSDRDPQYDLPIQIDFSQSMSQSPLPHGIRDRAEREGGPMIKGVYALRDQHMGFTEGSPLFSRAWVLQERLLSPRLLHFGSTELFWECSEFQACESHPLGSPMPDDYIPLGHNADSLFNLQRDHHIESTAIQHERIGGTWELTVEKYADSHLTKERDRLIAISAIAREIKPMLQCPYLAGHWEKDLVTQLCWSINPDRFYRAYRPTTYRAPSWSWASVEGECSYLREYDGSPKVNPPEQLIEVLAARIELVTEDDMGLVKGGYLDVSGQLSEISPRGETWQSGRSSPLLIQGLPTNLSIDLDDAEPDIDGPVYCLMMVIYPDGMLKGLALQRIVASNLFRRIGFVTNRNQLQRAKRVQEDQVLELFGKFETGENDGEGTFVRNDFGRTTIRIV
ncbi:MAG: hypothetical protein Q9221_001498 [Calogaya cf. arnoldii]